MAAQTAMGFADQLAGIATAPLNWLDPEKKTPTVTNVYNYGTDEDTQQGDPGWTESGGHTVGSKIDPSHYEIDERELHDDFEPVAGDEGDSDKEDDPAWRRLIPDEDDEQLRLFSQR